jgi:hypothetical protein
MQARCHRSLAPRRLRRTSSTCRTSASVGRSRSHQDTWSSPETALEQGHEYLIIKQEVRLSIVRRVSRCFHLKERWRYTLRCLGSDWLFRFLESILSGSHVTTACLTLRLRLEIWKLAGNILPQVRGEWFLWLGNEVSVPRMSENLLGCNHSMFCRHWPFKADR